MVGREFQAVFDILVPDGLAMLEGFPIGEGDSRPGVQAGQEPLAMHAPRLTDAPGRRENADGKDS